MRPASSYQYGLLRFIGDSKVPTGDARWIRNDTLASAFRRGWVVSRGNFLAITREGQRVRDLYRLAGVPRRKVEGDPSGGVASFLELGRRLRRTA